MSRDLYEDFLECGLHVTLVMAQKAIQSRVLKTKDFDGYVISGTIIDNERFEKGNFPFVKIRPDDSNKKPVWVNTNFVVSYIVCDEDEHGDKYE